MNCSFQVCEKLCWSSLFVGEGVGVIGDNFNASKKRSQVLLNHNASFLYAAKI